MDAPREATSGPVTAVAADRLQTVTGRENTMKAIVLDRYGPPEVLELREIDKPTPKDNEVLVKVHATTVNRTDCGFRLVATMPANVSFEEAAASTEGSHYGLWFIRKAKIRSGQDVLVNGATGAVGSAAVQLLKSMGAEVTAVCDTKNVELVRGLGADRVIDYTAEDFTKDTQTYDVVLDAVGMSS